MKKLYVKPSSKAYEFEVQKVFASSVGITDEEADAYEEVYSNERTKWADYW